MSTKKNENTEEKETHKININLFHSSARESKHYIIWTNCENIWIHSININGQNNQISSKMSVLTLILNI